MVKHRHRDVPCALTRPGSCSQGLRHRFDLLAKPLVGRVLLVSQMPDHVHRQLRAGHRYFGVSQAAHQVLVQEARHRGQQGGTQHEGGQSRKSRHLHHKAPFNALTQQVCIEVQWPVGGVDHGDEVR
jgi:hypothetical protein